MQFVEYIYLVAMVTGGVFTVRYGIHTCRRLEQIQKGIESINNKLVNIDRFIGKDTFKDLMHVNDNILRVDGKMAQIIAQLKKSQRATTHTGGEQV